VIEIPVIITPTPNDNSNNKNTTNDAGLTNTIINSLNLTMDDFTPESLVGIPTANDIIGSNNSTSNAPNKNNSDGKSKSAETIKLSK
jgi:hypothetical protein